MARPPNEDRQPEILDATCRVIARNGIPGTYVRHVAEEAGVSRALVSYYFPTRDDLLQAALGFAEQRAIEEIASRATVGASALDRITDTLILEFDDSPVVRDNWVIWSELTEAALFDPSLRGLLAQWSRAWDDRIAEDIRTGQAADQIPASVDPEAAAARLTGLVDGLGNRWLLEEITPRRAQELVRSAVGLELGSPDIRPDSGSRP